MKTEIWKDVPGFKGRYQISTFGRVKSFFISKNKSDGYKGKIMVPAKNSRNYFTVLLSMSGVSKTHSIHRMVAEAFIPNPNNYPVVRHLDDIQSNNNVENLAWGTLKDNAKDMKRNGITTGPKKFKTKKYISFLKKIFISYINNDLTRKEMAKKYNIKIGTMHTAIKTFKLDYKKEMITKRKRMYQSSKKINKKDVPNIRYRYNNFLSTIPELAKEFGVSYCNMHLLVNNKIFKDIN